MREIKFRGKAIMSIEELELMGIKHDNGWVYGNLIKNGNRPIISSDILEEIDESIYPEWWVVVEPGSVGQYTGLKDKNGTPIYEGDIVTGESFETSMLKHWKTGLLKHLDYEVEYVPEMYVIKYHEASFKIFDSRGRWVAVLNHHVASMVEDLQVIGNVFENPELLEVERMNEFCPTCSGSGGIEVFDWSIGEVVTIPCPDCGGSEKDTDVARKTLEGSE